MQQIIDSIKYMDKKVLMGLLLFLILLIALPLVLLEVKTQQTYNQHAATGNYANMDVCGNLVAISGVTENPSCGTSSNPVASTSFNQYSTEVTVQNQGAHSGNTPLNVTFTWEKYWCNYVAKDSSGKKLWVCGGPDDPNHNATTHTQAVKTITLNKGDTVTLRSDINQAQQACGTFQNDLTFSYSSNGQSCGPGNPSTGARFQTMNWGFCETSNATCSFTPTNTPTPTSGITPTNTPTSTPGVTLTDTPTSTPGITLTDTPTTSPTSGVTTTPTNTPPPGSTPTPTPTTPPGSTPTPTTPVISTPKPTLPPTGPGDTLFGVGIAGVAIALIGVIFVLAF